MNMSFEKFAIEETLESLRSIQELRVLDEMASNFVENFSPFQNIIKTTKTKLGTLIETGEAGAKRVLNPKGELTKYRKCMGYGTRLEDGTPTLLFRTFTKKGETDIIVKTNTDGSFTLDRDQTRVTALNKIIGDMERFIDSHMYWENKVQKTTKTGKQVSIGDVGAKIIEDTNGNILKDRRCLGPSWSLADGTHTLTFRSTTPRGESEFVVKPKLNGGWSLVRPTDKLSI